MGTTRLGIFPSLDNKVMYDLIDKGITEWILGRFPIDFFTNIYIDNQSNVAQNYTLNKTGELTPVNAAQELQTPYIRIKFNHGINNQSELFGTDIMNPNQQPGAFAIDTDLIGYRPIYQDPFHTIISLNERSIKVDFEIEFQVQNKSDQIGFINYLDTFLKMNYVQTIDIPVVIPMHNLLMEYLRSCLFKPEILALDRMIDDKNEKLEFKKYINEMFTKMMYEYSEYHIKPYKAGIPEKDSKGDNFDTKNYTFCYNQINRVFVKLEKYNADEMKKNNMWTGFKITMSGTYDMGIPISFITSVPAIIRGTRNNWYLKTGNNKSRDNYYQMLQFKEVFLDNRHIKVVNPNVYRHFYFERELLMSSATDSFDMLGDIITLKECPSHYYILTALLNMIKSKEEFNMLFKVVIYKNNEPIPETLFKIDEKFHVEMYECDLSVPYYIDIFVNQGMFENHIDEIRTKLENEGINWWKYFNEVISNDSDFAYFTKILGKDFRSYFMGETGRINNTKIVNYKYVLNPYESNNHVDRGYRGIGYIPHYKVEDKTDDAFIPIVSAQFLTLDPQFKYYVQNADDNYIEISIDDAESVIERKFVYIKVGKKYVACDPIKVLIPDPKYDYYLFDKEKNVFLYQENIEKFDILKQYYIRKDQYRYNVPEVENWN